MDYLKRFGIERYINAHDTITLYGGSRMGSSAIEAALQAASTFVDFDAMQRTLDRQIAELTHNEDAFICGGAAAGVQLAAAVMMAKGSEYAYRRLPHTDGRADEFIVFHSNMNCYFKSIEAAGGRVRLIGDVDETPEWELEGAIGERTAGVFLFPNRSYDKASITLRRTAEIAHSHGIPVAVDAAAYLPPVENLWRFTQEGADLVIFSGGKTLSGPQSSGLIVGRKEYIEDCRRFGEPAHGICRSAKVSREAAIALRVAVEEFVSQSTEGYYKAIEKRIGRMVERVEGTYQAEVIPHGSVGQSYPRLSLALSSPEEAVALRDYMKDNHVFIGIDGSSAIISAQNMSDDEADTVSALLCAFKEERR